ncbi:two-partner secretion domain-containing protein [Ursidibacter arcticus]
MRKLNLISIGIYTTFATSLTNANVLPTGEQVTHGNANINRTNDAMTINQESNVVSIDWNSFNIGEKNSVEFKQPSSTAIAYNRVKGGNASEIQGKLTANGRVFLSNPDGVIFSKTSQVNVGALLATTKELEKMPENLDREKFKFVRSKQKEGQIKNQGKITANGQNGFIALVGDEVSNDGELNASNFSKTTKTKKRVCSGGADYYCEYYSYYGYHYYDKDITDTISTPAQIILASGENFTVELPERATAVDIVLDANTMANIVENNGAIIAENGYIELTAKGQEKALNSSVNNNGILQATTANVRGDGKITLTAENINLGENSNIEAQKELVFTSPHRNNKEVKISSNKGSKILAEETNIKVNKLEFTGEFDRATSESSNFYSADTGKQRNKFNVELDGKISIGDTPKADNSENFISNSALASMLGNSGKVTLNSKLFSDPITKQLNYGGFEWKGNFNLNTFKESDAFLSLTTSSNINIQDANINTKSGRLRIATQLWDYKDRKLPENTFLGVNIKNSTLNLGNGAIGIGRNGRNVDYVQSYYFEEDRRSYFDVNVENVQLKNIDDFVIAGGMGNVNFNNVSHTGRSNFYIHGGNSRVYGGKNTSAWEYAIKDLEERIQRSEKNHNCEKCRRWGYSTELDYTYIPREFVDTYDSWIVDQKREHLETQINMTNTNLNIKDGFLHLMAKNINLKDSNINIDFDRNLTHDPFHGKIHKLGLNGNTTLDNTHIRITGAEKNGVSPDKEFGIASFFFIGDMLGKNKSSIFVKSNEGYTVRTNGNSNWKGEKGKDDLDITIINSGISYNPDKYKNGFSITADYPELGHTGFSMAATTAKVVLENLKLKIIAPNGAPAYHSSENLRLETKNADFSYFERPRTQKQNEAAILGNTTKLNLTEKQLARELDSLNGITGTNLSLSQTNAISENKLSLETTPIVASLSQEKDVTIKLCIDGEECKEHMLGNKHTNSRVSVGDVK